MVGTPVTGPLAQQFEDVRAALDTLHYYGAAERHSDDDCPVCGSCDEGYAALSAIERHVQDMETEVERVGILATAVGVARLDLANGDADSAKGVLDDAAAKTHEIIRAALLARGYDGEQVDSFLGAALPAREKGA